MTHIIVAARIKEVDREKTEADIDEEIALPFVNITSSGVSI